MDVVVAVQICHLDWLSSVRTFFGEMVSVQWCLGVQQSGVQLRHWGLNIQGGNDLPAVPALKMIETQVRNSIGETARMFTAKMFLGSCRVQLIDLFQKSAFWICTSKTMRNSS